MLDKARSNSIMLSTYGIEIARLISVPENRVTISRHGNSAAIPSFRFAGIYCQLRNMDLSTFTACILFVVFLPVPLVFISDLRRNKALKEFAGPYHFSLSIRYYSLRTMLRNRERLTLRRLEGDLNGRHVIIDDEYANQYFDLDSGTQRKDKLRYLVPWWGRYFLIEPNNVDQCTKVSIDGQETYITDQKSRTWSGFARCSVLKNLIDGIK